MSGIHHSKTDTLTNMLRSTNVHLSMKKLAGSLVQAKTFRERILIMVFGFREESHIFLLCLEEKQTVLFN